MPFSHLCPTIHVVCFMKKKTVRNTLNNLHVNRRRILETEDVSFKFIIRFIAFTIPKLSRFILIIKDGKDEKKR